MEIKTTTAKADGFKVTPEWLKAIGIDLENYPTFPQALKAKKEADIVEQQGTGLFLSKPVQWVFQELRRKYGENYTEVLKMTDIFNYGYILGIRAERARRKSTSKQP